MKANTPELLKFKRLQRRLGVSVATLCGHLELLWISTAKNAPEGDIGRFSNEDIAIGCYWDGDADEFVEALVDCGWLDRDDTYRFLIHDWKDHAPSYVAGFLKRYGRSFREPTRHDARHPAKDVAKDAAIAGCPEHAASKPSLAKPSEAESSQANPVQDNLVGADAQVEVPPVRKKFVRPTLEEVQAFGHELNSSVDPQLFHDHYEAQGWKISNGRSMVDWKASFRKWNRSRPELASTGSAAPRTFTQLRVDNTKAAFEEVFGSE